VPAKPSYSSSLIKPASPHKKAVRSTNKQRAALKLLAAELKTAGVAVNNLKGSEERLVAVARRVASQHHRVASALAEIQTRARAAGSAMRKFGADSRTSLGFMQRLRGEVVATTTAFVGLFGIAREAGNIFGAVRQQEAIESRFRVAFDGDPGAVAAELQFVRDASEELKISFLSLGQQYSKFIAAVPQGNFTLDEMRGIFKNLATGARVMRLSTDELNGVFKAVIQIASKGTFQMEELRGQLGDRLPGAVLLMAKSLGVSTRALSKMVEQGQLSATELVGLGEQVKETFGKDLDEALSKPAASLDDFLRRVELLRVEIGRDSGFVDALGEALEDLSTEIEKPAFRQGLADLVGVLGDLAKAGVVLVRNLDVVKNALLGFIAVRGLTSLIAGFFSLRTAILAVTGAARTAATVFAVAAGPAGWIVAVAAGLLTLATRSEDTLPSLEQMRKEMGKLADESDRTAKSFENLAQTRLEEEIRKTTSQLDEAVRRLEKRQAESRNLIKGSSNGILGGQFIAPDAAKKNINEAGELVDLFTQKITKLRGELDKLRNPIEVEEATRKNLGLNEKQIEVLATAIETANKQIDKFEADTFAKKLARVEAEFKNLLEIARSADDPATRADQVAKVEAAIAAKKRSIRLEEEQKLQREFERLESSGLRKSADGIAARLKVIEDKYASTIARLREIGLNNQADRLLEVSAAEQTAELDKLRDKAAKTITQLRATDEADLDARLEAVRAKYKKLIDDLNAAGEVDLAVNLGSQIEGAVDRENLAVQEENINRLMAVREATINRINAQEQAGIITRTEAQEQYQELLGEIDPQLQALVDKAILFAQAMGDENMVLTLQALSAELALSAQSLDPVIQKAKELEESFASGLSKAVTDWATGIKSAKDVFRSFAADFLRQIAQMILKQIILNALQAANPFAGAASAVVGAAHTGAVAGGPTPMKRTVSPLAFLGAYRYHGGGIAGSPPDEVPLIAQRGEELVPKTDPRHRSNGGAGGRPQDVNNINVFSIEDAVAAAIATPSSRRAIINVVGEESSDINKALGND
jgi:tape measure domain-containing protein